MTAAADAVIRAEGLTKRYGTALALPIGLSTWAGAASQDAGVGLGSLVAAGANCLPAALLFLGLGTLLFALVPRQSAGAAMAVVGVAFLWELVGAVVGAPSWALAVSPFHHVAAVPVTRFDSAGAAIMLVLAAASAGAGVAVFSRRDLQISERVGLRRRGSVAATRRTPAYPGVAVRTCVRCAARRRSSTPTSMRSTRRSSSATTRRCAAAR